MNIKQIKLTPAKTYKTEANAIKAIEAVYGPVNDLNSGLRFVMMTTAEGRFFPIFIGNSAIEEGVHFNFCVVN